MYSLGSAQDRTRIGTFVRLTRPPESFAVTLTEPVPALPERTTNEALHEPSDSFVAVTVTPVRPGCMNVTRGVVDSRSVERKRTLRV